MKIEKPEISKNSDKNEKLDESIHKGSCVKIKNSQKTFQVIGLNTKNKICWLREWPIDFEPYKTFPLSINQIRIKTFCSNNFTVESNPT